MKEIIVVVTCDECAKEGSESTSVNVHLVRHEIKNADTFEMDLCSTCYSKLFDKARRIPGKSEMDTCSICGEEFKKGRGMTRHLTLSHPSS